jgi:hypothetical protein
MCKEIKIEDYQDYDGFLKAEKLSLNGFKVTSKYNRFHRYDLFFKVANSRLGGLLLLFGLGHIAYILVEDLILECRYQKVMWDVRKCTYTLSHQ